ncbi:MAG: response regulator transcription factor [Bacteroidota bacterium]
MERRILIVEDELLVAYHIAAVLNDEGYPAVRIAKNLAEAYEELLTFKPHLVLTDITLGKKPDGIALGIHIRQHVGIPFIYITSHSSIEMIREASRTKPKTYLVKPFKTPDLLAAIEVALAEAELSETESKTLIWIKDGISLVPFEAEDIVMLQARENYTIIHTATGKSTIVRHMLSGVQNMLPESRFVRVHKSFIVNISQISGMKSGNISVGQHLVPVGRTYRQDVQRVLD